MHILQMSLEARFTNILSGIGMSKECLGACALGAPASLGKRAQAPPKRFEINFRAPGRGRPGSPGIVGAVSYTHLTLPTILLV